jgi:hypothetical protein
MPEPSRSVTLATMRRWATGVALGGTSITLTGACLTWVRSGRATRSSFATLRSARVLGVLDGVAGHLAPLWFLLPAVVGVAWLAAGLGRPRWVGALAVLIGVGALAAVAGVARSPLPTGPGVPLTAAGGSLALIGGLVAVITDVALAGRLHRSRGRPRYPLHKP